MEPEDEGFRLGEMTKSTSSPDTDGKTVRLLKLGKHCKNITRMHPQFTSFSVRLSQAHGAALALWGHCGLAVTYILTHQILTKHRAHFTYTHSTWLGVPYLIVGVDFAILRAGIFMEKNNISTRGRSLSADSWSNTSLCSYL